MRRVAALLLLTAVLAAALAANAKALDACPLRSGAAPVERRQRASKECSALVHTYMAAHTADLEAQHDASKFVFFLHVPRTAGKTYANCFLRTALPPSKRCAKSYDVVRLNVSAPDCQALVSHDDFSISQWFPSGATTITQLRKPVDRLISAYEFAVDVAGKGVTHTGKPRKNPKRKADFVGTLEVWPWSILIPWFKQDMRARLDTLREAAMDDPTAWRDYKSPDGQTYYWNEALNQSVWVLPEAKAVLDPYNNSLVMPLHEWIEHPIAEELLHNGATLQVLGATNYSYWKDEAAELRGCVRSSWVAREMLLALATKRLKSMAHVGLTERLDESVQSMAADLGLSFTGPAYKYTSASAFSYDGGATNDDDPVTFNATTQGGVNVTLTRAEATQRMAEILAEEVTLQDEIDFLVPRLTELVEQEARWLDDQEAEKLEAEAQEAAGAGEAAGVGGKGNTTELDSSAAAEAEDGGQPGASTPEVAAAEGGKSADTAQVHSGSRGAQLQADAAEQPESADVDDAAAPDGAADQGTAEQRDEGQSSSGDGGASGSSAATGEQGAEAGEAAKPAKPEDYGEDVTNGAEQDEEQEHIDSPWAAEIERLDAQLAAKQERMRQLEADLASLQHSELITSADSATGRARQILPDSRFLLPGENLGQAYRRCAEAGRGRNDKRRPYKQLRTPWGETFVFNAAARSRIAPATLARIRQLNSLDEELWKAGHEILERKLAEQRERGLLQEVPPAANRPVPNPHAVAKRRLQSSDEFVTKRFEWQKSSFGSPAGGGDVLYVPSPPPPEADAEAAAEDSGPAREDGEHAAVADEQAAGEQLSVADAAPEQLLREGAMADEAVDDAAAAQIKKASGQALLADGAVPPRDEL